MPRRGEDAGRPDWPHSGSTRSACPLGPYDVVVVDDVITGDEQAGLVQWADTERRLGRMVANPADPGAWCSSFQSVRGGLTSMTGGTARGPNDPRPIWVPDARGAARLPAEFWEIRRRVGELLGLQDRDEDPYKGSFLSSIDPGTGVHGHRDARLRVDGAEHLLLRCNVLLLRPPTGGLPVIESHRVDVSERGMWAFFPSEVVHSATAVGGGGRRGLLSFGFRVHPDEIAQRRYRLAPGFVAEYGLDGSAASAEQLLGALAAAADATELGRLRRGLFGFAVTAVEFSVAEVADHLGCGAEELWPLFRDFRRSAVIEASHPLERGCRVTVV